MRLLFDLQACQTDGSAQRGVGRYSSALLHEIIAQAGQREVYALTVAHHPHRPTFSALRKSRQIVVGPLPDWQTRRDFEGGEQDSLDAAALASVVGGFNPDVVHVSHLFEGYGDRVALPFSRQRPTGQLFSATLYDLIPLRFQDHYFRDARFKRWYLHRLQWLREADLLLSISESSRQDAIDLLGLDPSRVVTIHGGIPGQFKPATDPSAERRRLADRYGIRKPLLIVYTGGDDHRKNLHGAILGYARLPDELRARTLFVIICAIEPERKAMYMASARKLGIRDSDLLFAGFVPEEDLVGFYTVCDLFVFPSLYEGLGLPVLEAMACGAPVIAGDNSSLRELVPGPAALFDPTDPEATSASMCKALTDPQFANWLREAGTVKARQYTWSRSARIALDAFDAALERKRRGGISAAQSGWLKRPRLAMFTPLPPCRSGIADYNARFLPYLSEHFDIDLFVDGYQVDDAHINASHRIFDAGSYASNAAAYDATLYELGNSEFHAHMLPLLAEFPGIVGLHDAFLSGLMGYLEFHLQHKDRYFRAMLDAHHGQARRYLAPVAEHPNAVGACMVELPCTLAVLQMAVGLISHSSFNLDTARRFYPQGWPAPYRIIRQMVELPAPWSAERTAQTRRALGVGADDFVIATFGHVAWTKCGDRLLEAFLTSELADDERCRLLFVGEPAKDDFGRALVKRIGASGLGDRVRITGFLPDEDYEQHVRITDLAVQLRVHSRGGTPKGVLDCMAQGIPVVLNNEASYCDYPDDVVIKLAPDPSIGEIAAALSAAKSDPKVGRAVGERARAYVRAHHDPRSCAAQYAAAILEFKERHSATRPRRWASVFAPHLSGCSSPVQAAQAAASFLDAAPRPRLSRRRLIIDVSHISSFDHGTGIQRVVRETMRAAYLSTRADLEAVAVELHGRDLLEARSWLSEQRLLLPFEAAAPRGAAIEFAPDDQLLMLDSSWDRYAEFAPAFEKARSAGASITTAIYDLLPITLPSGNFVEGGREWFEKWLRLALASSDNFVCISRAVADELIAYLRAHGLERRGMKIGYWHLGAGTLSSKTCPPASDVRRARRPYLLMIGTIEPRKNHALALSALEILWEQGVDLSLVIVGRAGWMVEDLIQRAGQHRFLGTKLFLFPGCDDIEIAHLYRNAAGLLLVSKGEGFGLPLVEAAQFGTPLICSRLPVFEEVAGRFATYVDTSSESRLAADLADWLARLNAGQDLASTDMPRLNWEESANQLLRVLLDEQWYVSL